MAGNAKRVTKKIRLVEDAFVGLPLNHRTRAVWHAIAKVSGVAPARAEEHFRLGLALLEAGAAK